MSGRGHRPHGLSLARFEAGGGHSQGRWLIKQLPGLALMRHKSGKWKLHAGLAILTPDKESQEKAWGRDWAISSDRKYMRISGNKYQTLNEALCAIEQFGQAEEDGQSALPEMLA